CPSYFAAQNRYFSGLWPTRRARQDPPEAGRRVLKNLIDSGGRRLRCSLLFHGTADVDDVVGDHAEPDPTLHSGIAPVMASVETVAPFAHADASLASGPPLLAVAEPALPLLTLALGALGRTVGNPDAFDALGLRCCLVLGGVECGVRHHVRRTPQHCSMRLDGGNQQVRIAQTPIIDLVVNHDLVL